MSARHQFHALPDLVRDSKLEGETFSAYTKNVIYVSRPGVRERERIEERWNREQELGHGAYGTVRLERCDTGNNTRLRAVKEIRKMLTPGYEFDYGAELEAIMKFSHRNSYGWYESSDYIFIAMEYLEHGDLQRHLAPPLPEHEARLVATQVLEGLKFMHENGFTHRDLKPGNILVVTPGPNWFVKIADFGISKRRHKNVTSLHTLQRGSLGYAAPEALGEVEARGSYTSSVDMWSLGAVTYAMLTGTPPHVNLPDVFMYAAGHIQFPLEPLKTASVTQNGQQFITALMEPDGRKRLSSKNADKHPWMTTPLTIITASIENSGDTIQSIASAAWSTIDENPTLKEDKNWSDTSGKPSGSSAARADIPIYQPPSVEDCFDGSDDTHEKRLPKDSRILFESNTLVPGGSGLPESQGHASSKSSEEKSSPNEQVGASSAAESVRHLFSPRTSRPYASQGGERINKYERLSVSDSEEIRENKRQNRPNRSASTSELPQEATDTTRLRFPTTGSDAQHGFDNHPFSDTSSNCSSSGGRKNSADFRDASSVLLFEEVKNYRERLALNPQTPVKPPNPKRRSWKEMLNCSHCGTMGSVEYGIGRVEYLGCGCSICHRCLIERFALALVCKDFKLECCDQDIPLSKFSRILIDPEVNRLWDEGYVRESDKPGPDDKFILYLLRKKLISTPAIMDEITVLTGFYYEPKEKKKVAPDRRREEYRPRSRSYRSSSDERPEYNRNRPRGRSTYDPDRDYNDWPDGYAARA
ncbi:hypothetical protein NLG97_g4278 [Lecanicillium saksenae]|uniref:Uncharacterized protein n=1 Tax=Lecanicillium saksenae TaxID=468837 RepID=A0ACC1QVS3_9HYPO|nr:hypothetical protein NLG97_g4278 [Lecanicillium saksenae]